jgi:hypothetical protein
VGTRCRNCLESFVLSSNIEQYIAVPNTVSYGYDFNTIDRSVELLNDQKTIGTLKARRAIIVRNNNNVPFSAAIQNHISELHTDSLVDVIPNGLQSLSYLNLFYPNVATSKSFNMRLLPESLKCLRLAMNPELRYRISYQLDHLVNLQTLYLIDGGISSQEVRYVREYGQRQQLRMLCIMGIVLRSGCRNVRNYWCQNRDVLQPQIREAETSLPHQQEEDAAVHVHPAKASGPGLPALRGEYPECLHVPARN